MQKFSQDIQGVFRGNLTPLVGATCSVYNAGTSVLATIYSDNGVTLSPNPFTTSNTGNAAFYAADGRYDMTVTSPGYTTVTYSDFILEDTRDSLTYTDTGIIASFSSTTAGYNQLVLQNKSAATNASTNLNVSNNVASSVAGFVELGINSSAFAGSGSFGQPNYGYIAVASSDLVVGTYSAANIRFVVNSGITDAMRIAISGRVIIAPDTAVPAGGTAGLGLTMSSTADLGIFFGSGLPTLAAAKGSLYLRTDGSSTTTRMYINTNGASTWTNVVTTA
jgi:hypothetical protein